MHQQFRHIRKQWVMENMEDLIPRLIPFFRGHSSIMGYNQMFGHELAHCMELVQRGQSERLKIENFGWPIGELNHTVKTATTECKVFAYQYLFEEALLGHQSGDLLNIKIMDSVLASKSKPFWSWTEDNTEWVKEARPKVRIEQYMEEYKPTFKVLLDKTVDYIVDECAGFI